MDEKEKSKISRRDFVRLAGAGAAVIAATGASNSMAAQAPGGVSGIPRKWDLEADVVVIGAGAVGLPAAIRAADAGASVIVVDTNYDVGGHAIVSGGNVPLGGGTSAQKKYKIEDSPDLLFRDLTDWSVVEVNGMPEYRYNDRGVQRALADNQAATYEFLVENGVEFVDKAPDNSGGHAIGLSARRENHCIWGKGQSLESPAGAGGTNLMRPLEASARKKGVKFLLNYHMDVLFREKPDSGRVLGIQASYKPTILPGTTTPLKSFRTDGNIDVTAKAVTVKAKKAVIIGTGGSTGNVNFRRIFDPRLTEEYPLAADEFSPQDGSGELAAMAIGASLWGTANQTFDRNGALRKRPLIGTRTNYIRWTKTSPIFPKVGAVGLNVRDWQNVVIVNQVGKRFYNEMEDGYPYGTHEGFLKPYTHADWRNPARIKYTPMNYVDAALAINEGSVAPDYASGPQWAIFDAEAVKREKWNLAPPATHPDYFFTATTLAELAALISKNPYQKVPLPAANLEATVKRYNMMVDLGVDPDFEKPSPKYKIATPPFYAAWATVTVHDTYAGLRINMKCQVLDMKGQVIPGLYCGGESAAGSSQHGLGRCTTQGYIAGGEAARERTQVTQK
jgi:succinate dehydrogenase/fumarate reductase flavoprotein subunit